jgi:hypothetical protein
MHADGDAASSREGQLKGLCLLGNVHNYSSDDAQSPIGASESKTITSASAAQRQLYGGVKI